MSANVATNFPPQTYSSSFFLNALTDDVSVPSNSSKKRARNTDNADSSNAVLDCFISTMHSSLCQFGVLVLAVVFQLAHCGDVYQCVEPPKPVIRTFSTMNEYQRNTLHFLSKFTFVNFSMPEMKHLEKNTFITYESNYIVKLMLNDKRIETIDKGAFSELFCVKYLLLQYNNIPQLENGTFDGLYSLEELYLNENNIFIISNETFKNLKFLRKLDLSHNKIIQLTEGTFDSLTSLWELRLDHNALTRISPDWFKSITRLNRLYVGHNQLSSPSGQEFKYLLRLDFLDLSNNFITTLRDELFQSLGRLSELDISKNQLKSLNVESLPSLQRIHVENNDWQCTDLQRIVKELKKSQIGIVINNITKNNHINLAELACYNGTDRWTTSTTSTTFIPWHPSKPTQMPSVKPSAAARTDDHSVPEEKLKDTRNILSAINELKTILVILIIIVVIVFAIDIIMRMDTCSRVRSRIFVSRNTEASLPLLLR